MKSAMITSLATLAAGCCCTCKECCTEEVTPAPAVVAVEEPEIEIVKKASSIALKPGEKKLVTLSENATTGFSWFASVEGEGVSATVDHFGPPETNPPLCGAPGSATVTIEAKEGFAGEATVTLEYKRPWEGGETAEVRKIKVTCAK